MIITKNITLQSVSGRGELPQQLNFALTSADVGVYEFYVRVLNGVQEVDYSGVSDAKIVFIKADGNRVEGTMAIDGAGLRYSVGTTELQRPGNVVGAVQLWSNRERRLTSARFAFTVLRDPLEEGAWKSQSDIPWATQLAEELRRGIDQVDEWLADPEKLRGPQGEQGVPGRGLTILGFFETFEELAANVISPSAGDTYGVGIAIPFGLFVWNGIAEEWIYIGDLDVADGAQSAVQSVNYIRADEYGNISLSAANIPLDPTVQEEERQTVKEVIDAASAAIAANTESIAANATAIESLLAPAVTTTHTILPADWQSYEGRYAAVIMPPEEGNARHPDPDVRFGMDDLETLNAEGMGPIGAEYDDGTNILRLIASEALTITVTPAVTWRSSYA